MVVCIAIGALIGAVIALVVVPRGLKALGFGVGGIVGGSFAALWHSSIGIVAPGSLFSCLQGLMAGGLSGLAYSQL